MNTSPHILKFFADIICQELGIVYHEANYYQLETRLLEIIRQTGHSTIDELWKQCQTVVPASVRLLILDVATNNETSFFRDPGVFQVIEEEILNEYNASKPLAPIRIWSAACSYGQEPYSLAMILESHRSELPYGYQVVATDIADRALKAAERGQFSQLQVQRGLPEPMLSRFFQKAQANELNHDWEVRADLKRNISFKKLNLLSNFSALGYFHLILCRNVLIYQSAASKRQIVSRLAAQLSPGGYLILGAAESMLGISDDFDMIKHDRTIMYRIKTRLSKAG